MSDLRPVHGFIPPRRWPTVDELSAHQLRMVRANAVESFAPTTLGTPTILDQFGTGECFGFAAVQGIYIRRQARKEISEILSPAVPYWFARREAVALDTYVTDSGSDPDSMRKALADFGACSMISDPFDESKVNERPSDVAMLDAQQVLCTLSPILATGTELWQAIQHAIAVEKLPVLVAVEVVPAFDKCANGIVDDPSGESRGLHAQCFYGVDDVGAMGANSWGLGWGLSGVYHATPRFIGSRIVWAGALEIQS